MALPDPLISKSDDILGGTEVFAGTRVPVQTLFDYLEAGDHLDEFLDDFPTVTREQAVAVLDRWTSGRPALRPHTDPR
jgi:uncharacterized protein (DUF433 family)